METDAAEIARGYKQLLQVEYWRDLKQLELRPVYHRKDERIVAHVQLSWLALLLIRTAEIATGSDLAQPQPRARPHPAAHLRHRPRHRVPTHPPDRQPIFDS